jgi:hypothetical protein
MSRTATKSGMASSQLVRTVSHLSWDEFNDFMGRVATLWPTPPSPRRLSKRETALLLRINAGPPARWQQAYNRLLEKRQTTRLSSADERQLLKLADQMERYDVKRLKWLTELAILRKLPLRALIKSLGLKTPEYV